MTPLQRILDALGDWVVDNGVDAYNVEYVIEPMTTAIANALNCEPETSPRSDMSFDLHTVMAAAGLPT